MPFNLWLVWDKLVLIVLVEKGLIGTEPFISRLNKAIVSALGTFACICSLLLWQMFIFIKENLKVVCVLRIFAAVVMSKVWILRLNRYITRNARICFLLLIKIVESLWQSSVPFRSFYHRFGQVLYWNHLAVWLTAFCTHSCYLFSSISDSVFR